MRTRLLGGVVLAAMAAAAARADIVVDNFESGGSAGGWTYGGPFGSVAASGGNPGRYWDEPGLDTFAPQLHTTTPASPFLGNYRARQVVSLSVDLILYQVDFSAGGRPLSLTLVSDNGTPGDFDDDWAAFTMHASNIPLVGEGWRHYAFTVPSGSASLPAGWFTLQLGPNSPSNPDWVSLVTGVDQVRFFYGDPRDFFIFQMWHAGADNVAIETVPSPGALAATLGLLSALRRRR